MATEKIESTDTQVKELANGGAEIVTETVVVETTVIDPPAEIPAVEVIAKIIEEKTEPEPWQLLTAQISALTLTVESQAATIAELSRLQADHLTQTQSLNASVDALVTPTRPPEVAAEVLTPAEPLPVEAPKPEATKKPKEKPPEKNRWI